MKPSIMLAIALLSGSLPLAAQQGSARAVTQSSPATLQTQVFLQQLANCPAVMNVSHLPDGSMIRTDRAHPQSIGQWLHIAIMAPIVASATLQVSGYSGKTHMTQTLAKNGPDAVRTVTVTFREMPNGQAEGNVWAPELTAVTSIDLVSVTYVDGTTWNAPSGRTCSVTPDPLMLISGR